VLLESKYRGTKETS